MVMAEYFTHDRLQELRHQIHHLHLTYLDTEDSPQKIDQRNKLEVCIREFLCIAPHNRKFNCVETAAVLHRSARCRKDFSGYRAALAWNALSIYAGNLLSQPWRKEYRQIKTYSGFYKHLISANLAGCEAMFEAMGYKRAGDGVLVLDGPVCPDRVTNISQDSIVAFVECQILKSIWEEVSPIFPTSWLEILEFREAHLCSPEQCARILKYRHHERRYQQQQQQQHNNTARVVYHQEVAQTPPAGDVYGVYRYHMHTYPPPPVPVPVQIHAPQHTCPSGHIYPSTLPPCPPACLYSPAQPYFVAPQYYAPSLPRYQQQRGAPQCHVVKPCNGYCPGAQPAAGFVCPTGQLIELDGTHNGDTYDTPDSINRLQVFESHKQLAKSTNLDSLTLSKSSEDGAGTFESWDYVYRNLESQGYYKELGDRGDVLQSQEKRREKSRKNKTVELEGQMGGLSIKKEENRLPTIAQSSSFDTLPQKPTNGTLAMKKPPNTSSPHPSPWNCNTCTYLNAAAVDICAMCGKSRRSVDQALAVGGPQCPRCTLVNQRDASVCQACDASLANSPTYI